MSEFEHRSSYGHIRAVDHSLAGTNMLETTFDNADTLINLAAIEAKQQAIDPKSHKELTQLGGHFVPLDTDGKVSSETAQYHAYVIAMNLALNTLDALCDQLDIDIEAFRKAWHINGFVKVLDLNAESVKSLTPKEQYEAVAAGIIATGHVTIDAIGTAYDELIDAMIEINPSTAANPGILRGTFGYVLGGGLGTLSRIVEEREVRRITASLDFDAELARLVAQPARNIDRNSANPGIDHASIANSLDTLAFYATESAEEYLGQIVESQLVVDERNIEILNALALVNYPNDLGNFSLDDEGEAFFIGTVLGLDVVSQIANDSSVEILALMRKWRSQRTHSMLLKMEEPGDQSGIIGEQTLKILNRTPTSAQYDELLAKLSDALGHEEDEATAFYLGFHYMMSTGDDGLHACIAAEISSQVKSEVVNIDDEIRRLLEG
jgi:hypothetical protein